MVPGTRSPGRCVRGEPEGDYLGLFKGEGREIGARKQQRGEREGKRAKPGSCWFRFRSASEGKGDGGERRGGRWCRAEQADRGFGGGGDRRERGRGTRMVLGFAGAGGGDRGWAAAGRSRREGCRSGGPGAGAGAGARAGGAARGEEGAAGRDEAGEGGKEWAAAELAADHIVLPQDGLLQRRLRRVHRALGGRLRRRLHRPAGRGREGPGRLRGAPPPLYLSKDFVFYSRCYCRRDHRCWGFLTLALRVQPCTQL